VSVWDNVVLHQSCSESPDWQRNAYPHPERVPVNVVTVEVLWVSRLLGWVLSHRYFVFLLTVGALMLESL
jgi:hypothetical protein